MFYVSHTVAIPACSLGPSINYVTLKSGKIDPPSPPVTPPSRMPKKMDAPPPRDVTSLGHFHIPPPPKSKT